MNSVKRIVKMMRGLADPLSSAYCRLYMAYCTRKFTLHDSGMPGIFTLVYIQVCSLTASWKSMLLFVLHGWNKSSWILKVKYYCIHMFTIDWLFFTVNFGGFDIVVSRI